jgi:Flp pilus assembly protein TadG
MLRQIIGDRRGAISILGAVVIVAVVGFAALALEYGNALLQQVEDQRIADLAAYSGALVYNATSSSSSANSAAQQMASLNGVSSSSASASVGSSPTGDGNQAVNVTVSTNAPLALARVLTTNTTVPMSAAASAEINVNAPGCVIALSGTGSGISLSGTGSITANNCQVESNSSICANSGANPSDVITTKYLSYDSGPNPTTSSCTISPPSGTSSVHVSKASASDPLAGNSEVSSATSRISTVASISSPSGPSVSTGTNYTFGSGAVSGLPGTCHDSYASSTHTVTCSGTGPFNFGSVVVGGCCSVIVNNSSSGATYNFSGVIDSGTGSGLTFNGGSNATYNMAGGLYGHGSAPINFSAGTFNIGTYSSCSGGGGYSICQAGSSHMTFTGPSTFTLAGGIYQDASGMPPSAALSLGYGDSSNSFNIGKSTTSPAYSLNEANGATLFGDATGSGDLFQMAGSITTSGGTCVALPATTSPGSNEHDINGNLSGAGGVVLGAGIYTVNGYINFGGGGGDVSNCPTSGTTTGLTGLGVTLVVSGTSTVASCGSSSVASAFCLGSGFNTVKLTAPSSGSNAGLAVIGPQSSSYTGAAAFANGASNTQVSGAFYFPHGQIYMSGAATLHDTVDSGACLELIGTQVTSSAGSALGSTCTGLGSGSSGTTIGLVR